LVAIFEFQMAADRAYTGIEAQPDKSAEALIHPGDAESEGFGIVSEVNDQAGSSRAASK